MFKKDAGGTNIGEARISNAVDHYQVLAIAVHGLHGWLKAQVIRPGFPSG